MAQTRLPEDQTFATQIHVGPHISLQGEYLARFCERARYFKDAFITVTKGTEKGDAKQTLGISSLRIQGGQDITISGRGPERIKAVNGLARLLREMEEDAAKEK